MTVMVPISTPRIVRKERNLWVRRVSSASQQVFANAVTLSHHTQFSVRKASMGSSLAAWLAG